MGRHINRLSAQGALKMREPGYHADGAGLYLLVAPSGTRSWVFRFKINGRAREMGMGSFPVCGLALARERRDAARLQLQDGIDPIEARKGEREAAMLRTARGMTFQEAAALCIVAKAPGWRNAKHAYQWSRTLEMFAYPTLGGLPVASIDTALVVKVLEPIWTEKPETASRLRGRIETVLAWATVREYRKGDNPARWRGHLDTLLARPGDVRKVRHMRALPYAELYEFLIDLRAQDCTAAKALEFAILCASRTGEVIGARWQEIAVAEKVWTIPAKRMKAHREHRVPLSDRALEILAGQQGKDSEYVFPSAKGTPLSNMALLMLLRRMTRTSITAHGFRSTFRDWAADRTHHPREVIEAALAHVNADKTESAYLRSDAIEKRRQLMAAWSRYCALPPQQASAEVVALHAAG